MISPHVFSEIEIESKSEFSPHQRRFEAKHERETQADAEEAPRSDEKTIHLKVFRYDPDVETKQDPRFDDFHVPYERGMTVLDALIYARDHFDSSLTFRHSCRMAVCGSDGFFINGRQRLGCQT